MQAQLGWIGKSDSELVWSGLACLFACLQCAAKGRFKSHALATGLESTAAAPHLGHAGAVHADRGALQHGDTHWAVHTSQAAALPATALQGAMWCKCRGMAMRGCHCTWQSDGSCSCASRIACIFSYAPGQGTCRQNCNPPCPPTRHQTDILLTPGSHASEAAVNKQLADKERVAAALENPNLLQMVDRCLQGAA